MTSLCSVVQLLLFFGCVHPVQFLGWDPRLYSMVQCDGLSPRDCGVRASQLCPRGYAVAEVRGDPGLRPITWIVQCY